MNIGKEKEIIVVIPLEEPVPQPMKTPEPVREPVPA